MIENFDSIIMWIIGLITGMLLFKIFTIYQFNKNEFNLKHKIEHLKGDIRELKRELELVNNEKNVLVNSYNKIEREKEGLIEYLEESGYEVQFGDLVIKKE